MKTAFAIAVVCLGNLDVFMMGKLSDLWVSKVNFRDYAVLTMPFEPNSMPVLNWTIRDANGTDMGVAEYRCSCGYHALFFTASLSDPHKLPLFNVHLWCPVCGTRSAIDKPE